MAGKMLPIRLEDLQAALDKAGRPTPANVSITLEGRRLDSKEAVLAWLVDLEVDLAAGRLVELGDGTSPEEPRLEIARLVVTPRSPHQRLLRYPSVQRSGSGSYDVTIRSS